MTSNRSRRATRSDHRRARHSAYRSPGSNGPDPHNVLCVILSIALLLLTAFTLGGLAAHPFAG